jgi:hypothetical protein
MYRAAPVNNPTLITIKVNASQKRLIRDELHRVNINQFTTYYDLDHLIEGDKERLGLLIAAIGICCPFISFISPCWRKSREVSAWQPVC